MLFEDIPTYIMQGMLIFSIKNVERGSREEECSTLFEDIPTYIMHGMLIYLTLRVTETKPTKTRKNSCTREVRPYGLRLPCAGKGNAGIFKDKCLG